MGVNTGEPQREDGKVSYRARAVMTDKESLAVSLTRAIAAAKNETHSELDVRLHQYIDAEALEKLVEHANQYGTMGWEIEFFVDELEVTVRSDGEITIR